MECPLFGFLLPFRYSIFYQINYTSNTNYVLFFLCLQLIVQLIQLTCALLTWDHLIILDLFVLRLFIYKNGRNNLKLCLLCQYSRRIYEYAYFVSIRKKIQLNNYKIVFPLIFFSLYNNFLAENGFFFLNVQVYTELYDSQGQTEKNIRSRSPVSKTR